MVMTKSRKLHRKRTRRYKRRGGQVTPLSDISTNSSMHDFDLDLDEPSNNTTSESIMSENSMINPIASAPTAANLLGQFNAAADDDSINLSKNTTAPSEASSENSFSDVASSFGNLGHGGKKKMKGGKKTRRHKKSRKSRRQTRR
jgi:hypothetical protein